MPFKLQNKTILSLFSTFPAAPVLAHYSQALIHTSSIGVLGTHATWKRGTCDDDKVSQSAE